MLDFPNTPTDGERSVQPNGVTYEWQATKERWISITTLGGSVVGGTVVQVSTSIIDDYLSQAVAGVSLKSTPLLVTDDAGQWFDVAFTPKYANSVLMFQVAVQCIPLGTEWISTGIFETGGAAEAFGQTLVNTQTASAMPPVAFNTTAPAGSTAPRNYVVRSQCNAATTLFINGRPAAASGGRSCSLIITEIQPNAIVEPILPSPLEIFVDGTAVEFSGESNAIFPIPAGVKEITVMQSAIQFNASSSTYVRLRVGGVSIAAGYASRSWWMGDGAGNPGVAASDILSSGQGFYLSSQSNTMQGVWSLKLLDEATNTWACTFTGNTVNNNNIFINTGVVTLAGPVDGIEFVCDTSTIASGKVNIQYENQGQEAEIVLDALANLYSEGSFDARLWGATSGVSSTPFVCDWVRVGNLVTMSLPTVSAIDVSPVGVVRFDLPFPSKSGGGGAGGSASIREADWQTRTNMAIRINAGISYGFFVATGSNLTQANLNWSNMSIDTVFYETSFSYIAAS